MTARGQTWWTQPAGGREVLRVALPMVVSMLATSVMFFTDRVFLNWDSQAAVAAALPAGMVFWNVISLPLGACGYASTFVAQYHGAGRLERIGPSVWQGVWIALAATPLVLLTVPLAPSIFAVAEHSPQVQQLEVEYYQICCYGAVFMLVAEALQSLYTGRGATTTVMLVNALAAGVNGLFDYAWILGNWGFPAMHIAGAAWSTNLGLAVKAAIYLILVLRPAMRRQFATASGCRWDGALFRRLLRFGGPSGMQMACEVLGFTLFMLFLGRLGDGALAATNLAFNVSTFAFMPVFGLGIAVSTLVGRHLGEERDDLAARATWTSCQLALVYMAVISVVYLLVPQVLLALYFYGTDDPRAEQVRGTIVVLLRYVAAYNLFDALGIVFVSAIKGAGDTRFVLYVTLVMAGLLTIGSWLAAGPLAAGLHGFWWLVTAWVWVVGAIYFVRFRQGRWRQMRVIEAAVEVA